MGYVKNCIENKNLFLKTHYVALFTEKKRNIIKTSTLRLGQSHCWLVRTVARFSAKTMFLPIFSFGDNLSLLFQNYQLEIK